MDKSTRGAPGPDFDHLPPEWADFLGAAACGELEQLRVRLTEVGDYYPRHALLRAFHLCLPAEVKAVIVGQDPYHGEGEANGLAFSFDGSAALPPSLRNIYKELRADLGWDGAPTSGDLLPWARAGVLLLNTILTVKPNEAGSHANLGWETWTDHVLARLAARDSGIVFILWGARAHKKEVILGKGALVVKGAHPSPLAANRGGFFGGKYFSLANRMRSERGLSPVHWEAIRPS